jgi:glycosyltransferase involved in cell wall biosynthesis
MSTAISIVIPAYNRVGPLRHTLASAQRAGERLGEPFEILLVDDGSEPPLAAVLADFASTASLRFIRQINQGSIVARMTGLRAAQGEFVLFLDSDDLIAPAKLIEHVKRLRADVADISYDDLGEPARGDAVPEVSATYARLATVDSVEELLLRVQPVPHGPVYRRTYILAALAAPLLPPLRECDSVGDIWLYYNLCIHPARVAKIDAPLTLPGEHDETRYSQHWERLGFASLRIMEVFMERCPATPATATARCLVGECAFNSWRRLPRGFDPDFSRRQLAVWRAAPHHARMKLGGPLFRCLAAIFGRVGAARLLRLRNAPYSRIRTIDDAELTRLSAAR